MIGVTTQIRIARLTKDDFRSAEWYAKHAPGQQSLWTDEDEQKHPRDEAGRWAHLMSRGEFHQQEKTKPGYDVSATNKSYWQQVKAAALEGKEVHPKADEEHRQIFGEAVPRPAKTESSPQRTTIVGGDEARFTGKSQTIGGGTFREVEMLEGTRKGQTQLVRDEGEKVAESERKKAEWQEQQAGFSRLHDAAGQPGSQSGKKSAKKLVEDFGEKIGGARKDDAKKLGPRAKKADDNNDERPAWARRYDVGQIAASNRPGEVGKWQIHDTKDVSAWGQPRQKGGLYDSKESAEAALPLIAVSRNHRVNVISGNMTDGNREFGIVRNITDRKRAVVKGGFQSEEDAMRYMATHAEEIIEHQFPRYEDYAYLDHVERHGPEHKTLGKDVTPADFQKAFQFRGGEFGNWQSGKDGVTSLNHAYDALHDLSDALGLPAKAVALNGDLAIAFGARGTGGKNSARAHYEPDARVMNLTKMKGAGSLAHEWSHALDWHLGNGEHAISDPSYKTKLRPEVAAAAKILRDVISTKETTKVREADRETKLVDKAKEALEKHFSDLENGLKGSSYRPAKPFTPEQQKQWDAAKAKILAGDVGESKYFLKDPDASAKARNNPGHHSFEPLEEMNALYKKATGRSFHTSNRDSFGHQIYWAINRFDAGNKRVASVGEGAADKIRGKSDFHNEAVDMDRTQVGNYYSLPHEMFARAFEAYVADKLQEKGIRSDYLVSRGKTDNRSYAAYGLKPFPEGEERKNINAAFDQFFAALKHQPRSDEKGEHIQLYTRDRVADSLRSGIECYSLRSDIDRAASSTDVEPSREQIEAGNYRKGRFRLWGKEIVIENPRGSFRSGCSRDGKCWSVELPAHYGYIRQHVSEADGDHVDVYIGRHPESEVVFIVDQQHPDDGQFDEHKCFIGFRSAKEVKRTYLAAFAHGGKARERFGNIATMTKAQFLDWLDNGDTSRPVCGTTSVVTYSRITDAVNQFVRHGQVERYANFNPAQRREHGRWVKNGDSKHDEFRKSLSALREVRGSNQARSAAEPFFNKPLVNTDSGITATVSGGSCDEMLNYSIVKRSDDAHAHLHAVANMDHLFPHAIRREQRPPKKGDRDKDIQAIHHFEVPMPYGGRVWDARITVKQFKQTQQGNRIYLVRALEIKKPVSQEESLTSEIPHQIQTSPTGFQERFAQLVSVVKQHLAEQPKKPADRDKYSLCVESLACELYAAQRGLFDESKHPRDEAGKFASAGESAKAGKSFNDWQQPIVDAFRSDQIDEDHPAWKSILHGTSPTIDDYNHARDVFGQHVKTPFGHYGKVTDVADDAKTVTVTHDDGATSKHFASGLSHLGAVVADQLNRGREASSAMAYLAKHFAAESIANNENISEPMRRNGLDPVRHKVLRRAIADERGKQVEAAKPKPSPARQAAMDRQNRNADPFAEGERPTFTTPPTVPSKVFPPRLEASQQRRNADREPPTKTQSVSGQQQGLFDRGEFTTGQKSLFNVIAPDKPKSKSNKTADLFARMSADVAAHLKGKATISPADAGIVVQADTLPGQREMFQRRGAVMRYEMPIPARPEWLKPKPAPRETEQQQPSKSKPSKGGWQKVGGSSVFVNSAGRITKGCPGLKGHHVGELIDEDDESRDHRAAKQAHAESRGLTGNELTIGAANKLGTKEKVSQHQSAKTAAKRMGVPTKDVLGAMGEASQVNSDHAKRMNDFKAAANKMLGTSAAKIHRLEDKGHDYASAKSKQTRNFDLAVASLEEEFPDIMANKSDPAQFVWDTIKEGRALKLSHDDIAGEAANMVAASRQRITSEMVGRMTKDVAKKMAETVEDSSFSFGANAAF